MSSTSWIVDDTVLRAITWALVHFLWQGTVLAAVLVAATRVLRSALARYAAGVATLCLMAAAPVGTFFYVLPAVSQTAVVVTIDLALTPATETPLSAAAAPIPAGEPAAESWTWFTLVPTLWFAGVFVFAARLAGGWMMTRRMVTRDVSPVPRDIAHVTQRLAQRLGLTATIRIVESARARVPAMVGWLRPVVLLPAATIVQLSPAQLEALIAHELVHIRRRDYLVNAIQMVVEAVLFFHPAVWWASGFVRTEREHCCDDEVVAMCDRMEYVGALARLVEAGQARMALAATDGSVLRRVQRLLDRAEPPAPGWTPMLVAVLMTAGLAPIGLTTQADATPVQAAPAAVVAVPQGAAAPPSVAAPVARVSPVAVQAPAVAQTSAAPAAGLAEVAPATTPASRVAGTVQLDETLRSRLAALESQLAQLARQEAELKHRREIDEATATLANVRAEYEAARAEAARVQQLVEIGRAEHAMAEQVRARARVLEHAVRQATNELEFRERNAALQQQRSAQTAEYDALRQQYERLVAESEAAKQRGEIAQLQAQRELDRQRQVIDERRMVTVLDNAAIAPGDVVRITIEGESDLPSTYTVSGDGAIRVPLLGRIVVQGRNAAAVRDEIRNTLTRTGLKPGASVTVEVLRMP